MRKQPVTKKTICGHCFEHNGRMWELRGTGKKALKKNKGMRRLAKKTAL